MATRTLSDKPPLVYSLPLSPPIPFPLHPTYPVQLPTRDLRQAYLDALWPPPTASNQSEQVRTLSLSRPCRASADPPPSPTQARLESFARLLLTLLAERAPPALNTLVRDLVLPLQDFDKRWRSQLPPLVEVLHSSDDEDARPPQGVSDDEAQRARDDYERWAVEEKVRLEIKRDEDERRRKGKQRAADQDSPAGAEGDEREDDSSAPKLVEVRPSGWLSDKELLECVPFLNLQPRARSYPAHEPAADPCRPAGLVSKPSSSSPSSPSRPLSSPTSRRRAARRRTPSTFPTRLTPPCSSTFSPTACRSGASCRT